jgi:hypothetical protein
MAASLFRVLAIFRPTNLLAIVLLLAVGYGGFHAYRYTQQMDTERRQRLQLEEEVTTLQAQNKSLQGTVVALEKEREKLQEFVQRLSTESRVARVHVRQGRRTAEGVPVYTLEFTEYDRQGNPLPSRIFDCVGKEVYFDALLIKFSDDAVKAGDLLRGKTLHLFRRAFGSAEEPRNGPLIATNQYDDVPNVYRLSPEHADFETRLWRLFWHWTAHPNEAAAEGVRINQVEAIGTRPAVGATYEITLEHDGGLNIKALTEEPPPETPAPAAPKNDSP